MKAIATESISEFKPIKFEITIENEKDLLVLFEVANVGENLHPFLISNGHEDISVSDVNNALTPIYDALLNFI